MLTQDKCDSGFLKLNFRVVIFLILVFLLNLINLMWYATGNILCI